MWTRVELKQRAKEVLKKNYWKGFLVTLVIAFLSGGGSLNFSSFFNSIFQSSDIGSISNSSNDVATTYVNKIQDIFTLYPGLVIVIILVVMAVMLVIYGIIMLYNIFVIAPFSVGKTKFFIDARNEDGDINKMLFPFKKGRYASIVKAMAWQYLFIFLWSLLFLIPGIFKMYSYSMVPYLMADNPELDYKGALKLSMHMTNGQKWSMFMLDLSFIGLAILGLIPLGVGLFFLAPYYQATKAELYAVLKNNATEEGLIVTY